MSSKEKFKPVISRVKLNSEQTVLACQCYNTMWYLSGHGGYATTQPDRVVTACGIGKGHSIACNRGSGQAQLPGADAGSTLS